MDFNIRKMGFLSPNYNHLLHFIVSLGLAVTFIIPLVNHPGQRFVNGISGIGLVASGVQAIYHFGVWLSIMLKSYEQELPAGIVARNLLTSIILVVTTLLMGRLYALGLPLEGSSDGATSRIFNIIGLCAVGVMRFLDLGIDFTHEKNEELEAADKFMKLVDVQCASEMEGEGDLGQGKDGFCTVFNARIVMVHILLLASGIFASIVVGGQNNIKLGDVTSTYLSRNMFAAMMLIWIHFILYPIAIAINACEGVRSACIAIHCGKAEDSDCSTLESLNRMPLVRSLVAGGVLSCLSFVLGGIIASSNAANLMIALGAYLAADAVGRNVV
jgi:hypothetical protein